MTQTLSETRFFDGFDGTRLAYREIGDGPPLVLIHGYFSDAHTNWIKYGHAATIAATGRRVVMPDLRGHGESARPHDAAAYPPDALTRDGHALVAHLVLTDYDLGGYSLGARTTARMVATGATPRRLIFAGMGLEGLTDVHRRTDHFRHVLTNLGQHERGTGAWFAEAFLKSTGGDPAALLAVLGSFVDTDADTVRGFRQPALVTIGVDDDEVGSAEALADALRDARLTTIPGNHMSAVAKPDLGRAIAAFVAGGE